MVATMGCRTQDHRRFRAWVAGALGLAAATLATTAAACPDRGENGQRLRYNGAQLLQVQSESVTAGGNADLGSCPGIPGQGHVNDRPDFTLNFARNNPGYDLDLRVEAGCDTVLLVNSPNGQWSFNDDSNGFNPRVSFAAAEAGASCVIQPGGSLNDDKVIAAADSAGLAMVFTGQRHFRH